ncbi:MAG: UDP-2,4-diacetamido-2,4,6-trideoxy-beta-L-altropyranose hydrolase [Selenomonadaceae bacterium]|nr:UDP-2,4-diacetamido-2,4,6-trideoxy-beta-L-altropyranose hydrolase [Selenomonadaceae bacterium]
MNTVFRADASIHIGSGHVMRCLTFAARMNHFKPAEIYFVSRDLPGNLNDKIVDAGYHLLVLPRQEPKESLTGYAAWLTVLKEQDATETIDVLKRIGTVDRLVIDSYAIDETWERMLRPYVGEIFVIDDLANRRHDCDVLLDYGLLPDKEEKYRQLVPKHCRLLLGVKYAPFRSEFIEAQKTLSPPKANIKNILIFYGGADATNETQKALDALRQISMSDLQAQVIVGSSNPHKESIKKYCAGHNRLNCHEQVGNMAEFMSLADVFICAGGTTLMEAWYMRLPTIVTVVAENQRVSSEYAASSGLIEYLGYYDEVSAADIARALQGMTLQKRQGFARRCEELFGEFA